MGTKIKQLIFLSMAISVLTQTNAAAQAQVYFAPGGKKVQAVVVDDLPLVHTSQFIAVNGSGQLSGKGDLKKQIDQIFMRLEMVLNTAQSKLSQIVKINVCIKDAAMRSQAERELNGRFNPKKTPAITFVVSDLRDPDALIGIDVVAVSGAKAAAVSADAAILPAGGAVYVSGQAADGALAEATSKTLKQLEETLNQLGLNKEDIVQIKSFVNPASGIETAEKEIARFFGTKTVPPLVFVEWLSKEPIVEIELIAASPAMKSKPQLEFITPQGMSASPVYAKVCRVNYGKKIYLSGLYGPMDNADPAVETKQIFESLSRTMKQANSDLNHLVKATYYVTDAQSSKELNTIRPHYYNPERPPAASKALVKGAGRTGASMTMDMIGVVPIPIKNSSL